VEVSRLFRMCPLRVLQTLRAALAAAVAAKESALREHEKVQALCSRYQQLSDASAGHVRAHRQQLDEANSQLVRSPPLYPEFFY
jgi:hypothetical protein